jgi:hypothetical protein
MASDDMPTTNALGDAEQPSKKMHAQVADVMTGMAPQLLLPDRCGAVASLVSWQLHVCLEFNRCNCCAT